MQISPFWALAGAIVPGIWLFLRIHERWAPGTDLKFLMSHFAAGAAIAVIAGLVELALEPALVGLLPAEFSVFAQAFIIAALIEESLKCVGIKAAADRAAAHGLDAYGALAAALSVGLGFAVFECAIYAFSDLPNSLVISASRYVTAVPLHYLNGMLFSIAYVSHRYGLTAELAWTFVVVVVAHGFYDYVLMAEDGDEPAIFLVLGGLAWYIHWMRGQLGIKTAAERATGT